MKTKVIQHYSPLAGNWWTIKVKMLLWWITSPICFLSKENAIWWAEHGDYEDLFEDPVKKVVNK